MMLSRCMVVGLISLSSVGCGIFQKESDDVSNAGAGPDNNQVFSLTGTEATEVTGAEVSAFVNSKPELLIKAFEVEALRIPTPSNYSRDQGSTAFAKCALDKINNMPLQVTRDTVSVDFFIDLTKECDREVRPDDLVGEIKNTLRVSATVGCSNGVVEGLGKTLGSAKGVVCQASAQKITTHKVANEYTIDARKVNRVKKGTEFEDVLVSVDFTNSSLKSKSGLPCNLVKNTITGIKTFDSCRFVIQSKKFSGLPKYENNGANEKLDPHPTVVQQVITVNGATQEKEADYYTSADSTFMFSGWEGKLTFVHGWTAPSWEATFKKAKRGGVVGAASADIPAPVNQ